MNRISEAKIMSAAPTLSAGGVVVLRTDTIYGITALANDKVACERVYSAKGRDASKPCIILVATEAQIWDSVSRQAFVAATQGVSDEPTSIIVPSGEDTPGWIPHGNGTVAFRLPKKPELRQLIRETGPLIAPSANPAGREPATSIEQAEAYFGDVVDTYIDGGDATDISPSHIVRVTASGDIERIR